MAVRELAVSAGQSVEVILPNNEVELNAFVVPAAKTGTDTHTHMCAHTDTQPINALNLINLSQKK